MLVGVFIVLSIFLDNRYTPTPSPYDENHAITQLPNTSFPETELSPTFPTGETPVATILPSATFVVNEATSTMLAPTLIPTLSPTETPQAEEASKGNEESLIYIPAGEFWMGSEGVDAPENEQPQHKVSLDDFWIYETEVTNAMFEDFVQETGYQTSVEKSGWSYTFDGVAWQKTSGAYWRQPEGKGSSLRGREGHPVVHISWYDANTYCLWSGGRLPTEAEWEKAARGTTNAQYPWGNNAPTAQLLNFESNIMNTVPVGSYPQGKSIYGVYDMSGNVWEWVSDWYDSEYYQHSPSSNPQGAESGNTHVFRGGSWDDEASSVTATVRVGFDPATTSASIGFRCVKNK